MSSLPNPSGQTNIFTLAADGSPRLLEVLRSGSPSLAGSQDATGYSVLHALASYNHVSQLRTVAEEFFSSSSSSSGGDVDSSNNNNNTNDVNMTDEDGETALFVAETVAAAQCLVEEVGVDWRLRNGAGETAEEKIRGEGDFVVVADYLAEVRKKADGEGGEGAADLAADHHQNHPPPLPPGVKMEIGSLTADQLAQQEPDPEFRRRIEELAAREDFHGEEGQAQLRQIVEDAVRGVGADERDVRQRTE